MVETIRFCSLEEAINEIRETTTQNTNSIATLRQDFAIQQAAMTDLQNSMDSMTQMMHNIIQKLAALSSSHLTQMDTAPPALTSSLTPPYVAISDIGSAANQFGNALPLGVGGFTTLPCLPSSPNKPDLLSHSTVFPPPPPAMPSTPQQIQAAPPQTLPPTSKSLNLTKSPAVLMKLLLKSPTKVAAPAKIFSPLAETKVSTTKEYVQTQVNLFFHLLSAFSGRMLSRIQCFVFGKLYPTVRMLGVAFDTDEYKVFGLMLERNNRKTFEKAVLIFDPGGNTFMDVAFDAVHAATKLLYTKLSELEIGISCKNLSIFEAKKIAHFICQQCEASLQYLFMLCQQKLFHDRLLRNKELYKTAGSILSLCHTTLKLKVEKGFAESMTTVNAIFRMKSKALSILLQLCDVESVSYLDEIAGSENSMRLAKSVALLILDTLNTSFGKEAGGTELHIDKSNPMSLVLLNSLRLADIFSDDSNIRSFFMLNAIPLFTEILGIDHEEFRSNWCSADSYVEWLNINDRRKKSLISSTSTSPTLRTRSISRGRH